MGACIELRRNYSSNDVRVLARRSNDTNQTRRLLDFAGVLVGHSHAEAARIGGMERQILRDRVHRFNGSGPAGLIDRKAPGQAPKVNPEQKASLGKVVK